MQLLLSEAMREIPQPWRPQFESRVRVVTFQLNVYSTRKNNRDGGPKEQTEARPVIPPPHALNFVRHLIVCSGAGSSDSEVHDKNERGGARRALLPHRQPGEVEHSAGDAHGRRRKVRPSDV